MRHRLSLSLFLCSLSLAISAFVPTNAHAQASCFPFTQQPACVPGNVTGVSGAGTFASIQEAICVQPSYPPSPCLIGLLDLDPSPIINLPYYESVEVALGRDVILEVQDSIPAPSFLTPAHPERAVFWFAPNSQQNGTQVSVDGTSRLELRGGSSLDGDYRRLMLGNDAANTQQVLELRPGAWARLDGVVLHRAGAHGLLIKASQATLEAQDVVLGGSTALNNTLPYIRAQDSTLILRRMEVRGDVRLTNGSLAWPHGEATNAETVSPGPIFQPNTATPKVLVEATGGGIAMYDNADLRLSTDFPVLLPKASDPNNYRQDLGFFGGLTAVYAADATVSIMDSDFVDVQNVGKEGARSLVLRDCAGGVASIAIYQATPSLQGQQHSRAVTLIDTAPGSNDLWVGNNLLYGYDIGLEVVGWVDDSWTISHNSFESIARLGLRFPADIPVNVTSNAMTLLEGTVAAAYWDTEPTLPGVMNFANNAFIENGIPPLLGIFAPLAAETAYTPSNTIHPEGSPSDLSDNLASWRPWDSLLPTSVYATPPGSAPGAPWEDLNHAPRPQPAATNPDQGAYEAP